VLLLDLDHFKRVNDRHGHAVGDELLRAFADLARRVVRSSDVLVRRGGEEFVLIMPNTRECHALLVAERLRKRVASNPLLSREGLRVEATISVGVASWNGSESAEALDHRADLAMYEAKQCGRNRTFCSSAGAPTLQLCGTGA
jgi:diguanylate cyclase (GGDEF)-like protein